MVWRFDQRRIISVLMIFIMLAAVAARFYGDYWRTPDRTVMAAALAACAVLMVAASIFSDYTGRWIHIVIAAELFAIFVLFFYPKDERDFFGILCIPICGDITFRFQPKTAYRWVAIVVLLLGVELFLNFDFREALPYWLTYCAACLFITAFSRVTLRAEQAQARSEALLTELTEAHQKLRAYAAQVEELVAAQERNRLARELHDSVTQTIFSMNLTAQAARMLIQRDPARAVTQLDRLQELAAGALAEMRQLIQHLRPHSLAEEGLVPALRRHLAERKDRDGLSVDLQVVGDRRLPGPVEETLFRVTQEALNNVVKHAGTGQAAVRLCLDDPVLLVVEDRGAGFDPRTVATAPGHLGLAGMAERVRALGGTFTIDSSPGAGTRVRVEALPVGENARESHG